MSLIEDFADLVHRAERSEDYWLDIAITDFARDLHSRMQQLKVTHKELAERMGTSRPYVTKLLSGGNFTLHTMIKLAMALDASVRVRLEGNEVREARARGKTAREAVQRSAVADFAEHRVQSGPRAESPSKRNAKRRQRK